jgi:hypothetical protein
LQLVLFAVREAFVMTFRLQIIIPVAAVLAGVSVGLPARAESHSESAPTPDRVEAQSSAIAPTEEYPLSVGARSFIAPNFGIAALGVGFDGAYSLMPHLAIGAQHLEYLVDQGADPYYCERCVRNGRTTLAFAEGRLLPASLVTPYARLGIGLSHVTGQLVSGQEGYVENNFSLAGELGVELHYRWAAIRAFAFDVVSPGTELDKDAFVGYGIQLGARL